MSTSETEPSPESLHERRKQARSNLEKWLKDVAGLRGTAAASLTEAFAMVARVEAEHVRGFPYSVPSPPVASMETRVSIPDPVENPNAFYGSLERPIAPFEAGVEFSPERLNRALEKARASTHDGGVVFDAEVNKVRLPAKLILGSSLVPTDKVYRDAKTTEVLTVVGDLDNPNRSKFLVFDDASPVRLGDRYWRIEWKG